MALLLSRLFPAGLEDGQGGRRPARRKAVALLPPLRWDGRILLYRATSSGEYCNAAGVLLPLGEGSGTGKELDPDFSFRSLPTSQRRVKPVVAEDGLVRGDGRGEVQGRAVSTRSARGSGPGGGESGGL